MLALFKDQPRAFQMIFMLEIWERFGYYTVQGILVLYFVRFIGMSEAEAYYASGAFFALVYGLIAVGGYLGDKVLGTRRTLVLGLFTLAAGYLSLALAGKSEVYYALGLICVGNGLFKANPSSLLAKCYQENDPRLHSGFTLYYMAINLGSTCALLAGPALAANYGYFYAFFLSFVGLVLGIANYWFQREYARAIPTASDHKSISAAGWIIVFLGIAAATVAAAYLLSHITIARLLLWLISVSILLMYINYMRFENRADVAKMIVALVLMVEGVAFFTLYQQMPTSLNLFAVNNVHPEILGISLDPQSYQAFNPIWIITLSPVLAWFYKKLDQNGIRFPIAYKFAAGMLCCGISFTLLYFARFYHNENWLVSPWWLVASYLFQSAGELLVSALGLAMVAELVPRHIAGFVMGMWLLTTAIAGFIGAWVASLTALPSNTQPGMESLMLYTKVFLGIGLITLAFAFVMILGARFLQRLLPEMA
ncbi:oligopeptide:H+ symporter [Legionella dresdenensis]|uniref:Oligopeptide:H+ symporter n=1 Tax=Legionella dresdenensis TaxID=450200 RepID=A0ABV8CHM5_9GAMM